ncbi:hypothetical protein LPJ61_004166 [Coemansia biformis]|uniref:chitinase n=1 Tax=Coemansia biformis TaxID=1286918 RepID=A0A9W8CX09_9FUNG|nr:hypothetical protein LPJ61_004166 [Coemansia biformis]
MTRPEPTLQHKDADAGRLPRLIVYYQTQHDGNTGKLIPVHPLVQSGAPLTHVIIAAIHINDDPNKITLNNDTFDHPMFDPLWTEVRTLQASGVKVMGMLGGAAKGSYARLDGSDEQFERYYTPLRDLVREKGLDGLDLDVEEEMSLQGVIKLIDRLRADFGRHFIITLAPVAAAMLNPAKNLSGFDYMALEAERGSDIAWYNTQFYCGWGDITSTDMYDRMVQNGWCPEKLVVGVTSNPIHASGFVPGETLYPVVDALKAKYPKFGGVMAWEYFESTLCFSRL